MIIVSPKKGLPTVPTQYTDLIRITKFLIIKSSLYSPCCAEAYNELWDSTTQLEPGQHCFEEASRRWRAVGDTVLMVGIIVLSISDDAVTSVTKVNSLLCFMVCVRAVIMVHPWVYNTPG